MENEGEAVEQSNGRAGRHLVEALNRYRLRFSIFPWYFPDPSFRHYAEPLLLSPILSR